MKNIVYLLGLAFTLLLVSCEDFSASSPSVNSVEILEQIPSEIDTTVNVIFLFNCTADDDVVVWWGHEGSNYDEYQSAISNPGSDEENITSTYPAGESLQNRNNWNGVDPVEHVYPNSGTYKMVVIATNTGDLGGDIKQTKYEQTITIQ